MNYYCFRWEINLKWDGKTNEESVIRNYIILKASIRDLIPLMTSKNEQEPSAKEDWPGITNATVDRDGGSLGRVSAPAAASTSSPQDVVFVGKDTSACRAVPAQNQGRLKENVENQAKAPSEATNPTLPRRNDSTHTAIFSHKQSVSEFPQGYRTYVHPREQDVCFGQDESERTQTATAHAGNLQFYQWIQNLVCNDTSFTRNEPSLDVMTRKVVDIVHLHGGRFLENDHNGWYEASKARARVKCSQILRDYMSH